ncbi:MAG: hypothetical protein GX140_10515 [Bacteroidales bacterium]|jgi:peptidyl-prolyl cis-trans isomerase D|nr:hypothetical protein [Bacteroidales bacterium]
MAIIGKIRKQSTLLLIVIGVALLAFIMGDFVRKSSRPQNVLGSIDGESISYTEFINRFYEQEDIYKRNTGKDNITAEEAFQIRNMIWENYLQEAIIGKEMTKLGISVTDEEMEDLIVGLNPHPYIQQIFTDPESGQFSPVFVEQFVSNLENARPEEREFFNQIKEEIKRERLNNKYNSLIAKSFYMPKAIAQITYENSAATREVSIVQVNYQNIPDEEFTLTDADYKAWYDEHKYFFKQEDAVDVEYVIFDIRPTEEDLEDIAEEVEAMYEDFLEHDNAAAFVNTLADARYDSSYFKPGTLPIGFDTLVFNMPEGSYIEPFIEDEGYYFGKILTVANRPDSIKASHLLIQYKDARGAETERTKEEAKAMIDSLLIASKRVQGSFEAAILEISEYPTAKQDEGNLDWMLDGDLNFQLFFDSLITTSVNDYRIVESALGYHLLKVTDKTAPMKKVQIAIGRKLIEPSENTIEDVYMLANKLSGESETIEQFNNNIIGMGLSKRLGERIDKNQYTLPGVKDGREAVRWCFDKNTKVGNVSQVYDVDGKYLVVALQRKYEEGYASLEDVKKIIEPMVYRDKKAEKLIADINAAGAKDLQAIADKYNTEVENLPNVVFASHNLGRFGPEIGVIGSIFGSKKGVVSQATKGEMGVYVYVVNNITNAEPTEDYFFVKMQAERMFTQRVNSSLFEALKEKTKIKDNRVDFF